MTPLRKRLVVIGNGMAGVRVLEELLARDAARYAVTVFGTEPVGNYNRIQLSPVLAGEKAAADIVTHAPEWYRAHGITLHASDPVLSIDRAAREVVSASGHRVAYDRLLLATGSNPFVLPVPGRALPGVVTFRTLADVETMLEASRDHRRAVVIGGGLLGLEAASGLARRGMDVTVVHLVERLMERQLDSEAARLLQGSLEARGLRFELGAQTTAILGARRVQALQLADGRRIDTDLVVMAAGIVPDATLARAAGLACARGVIVDDHLRTSDQAISAVGECAQHRNVCYGLVAPLWQQAAACAAELCGDDSTAYAGSVVATRLKVSGIELFSGGDFEGRDGGETVVMRDARRGVYRRLVLRDGRLAGALLYGDASDGGWYFELIHSGCSIAPLRQRLIFGQRYAEAA